MPNKQATQAIMRQFIQNEVKHVDKLIIIAKTDTGQLVMMNNDLTYDEIFGLMKLADIEVHESYVKENEHE